MPSASVGIAHSHGFALALSLAVLFLPPSAATAATAMAELIASLEATARYDVDKVAAVYREAVVGGTGIDRTVNRLRAYSRRPALSAEGRAACHLAIAHFMWRDGAIAAALASSDAALQSAPSPGALLLKARLLDADGEEDQARDWYQRAALAFGPGDEQWLVRVRLAMMDMSSPNVAALEELARQRKPVFRNQAAVVLALMGRPDRAITLYRPLEAAEKLYPQHVRLSEWALQAESHELAREQAWLAYAAAPVRTDRLYALGLLAESYRSTGELDQLIEDLAARESDDQDLLRLRVEALIETEEYHRAIELYEELEETDADIDERRRLVSLFEAAGDTDSMVREYRRLMDAEPATVQWYDALAAHFLQLADDDSALAVWKTLEARNGERAGVLLEGAGLMRSMGFVDEGVAMIERHVET
ncbi:MAG: tetratricopeptide repeat protein, partial [Gammaproteobacteria bacterium]|nr:tetratricopeptide repeat protein [Gammaproteobacteria bacterium]